MLLLPCLTLWTCCVGRIVSRTPSGRSAAPVRIMCLPFRQSRLLPRRRSVTIGSGQLQADRLWLQTVPFLPEMTLRTADHRPGARRDLGFSALFHIFIGSSHAEQADKTNVKFRVPAQFDPRSTSALLQRLPLSYCRSPALDNVS